MKHWWDKRCTRKEETGKDVSIAGEREGKKETMQRKWQRTLVFSQLSREKLVGKKEHNMEEKLKNEWTKNIK